MFKKATAIFKNRQLPFTPYEKLKNFTHYKLTEAETLILKFGLNNPLNPKC